MRHFIHYTNCPVCGSANLQAGFLVKDYTVSGESFPLVTCNDCTLRFTQDVPDAASIGPYYKSEDYISHTNTAKGLINRLYHSVRKRTLVGKRKLIQKHTGLSQGKLLDIGSGTGAFLQEMKQAGWQVTGLEPDEDARAIAKDQNGMELLATEKLYELEPGFDAITLWHVLEHVHDLHSYVEQMRKLLSPHGRLFIAVPNYTSKDAEAYKQYWAAYDVPRHLYHFSPRSIDVLMDTNGLKVEHYLPMWYDSFYISLLSSRYQKGNTNWPGAAWQGLRSNIKAVGDAKRCSSIVYVIKSQESVDGSRK